MRDEGPQVERIKQSLPMVTEPHNDGSPASRTQSKTALLRIDTAAATRRIRRSRGKKHVWANGIERMENEVHEALAVMDAETGKVFNYRQLMQSKKHKEMWSKLSANELGQLANGVGG